MKARHILIRGLLIIVLTFIFGPHLIVHANTLIVNTLTDERDYSCSDGSCSLRDAIYVASASDTITFNVTGTITLTYGQLTITNDLTISGPGAANLTINANNSSRVFYINSGVNTTISGVTITGGSALDGAGIDNYGTLTVTESTISGNTSNNNGGGIYNKGVLVVSNSTFTGNSAYWGGGIKNESAQATIVNSTFSGNSASVRGGGIDGGSNSTMTVTNSTFTANQGLGISNYSSTTTAINNIVAKNIGIDCSGSFTSTSTNNLTTTSYCSPGFSQITSTQLALGTLTGDPAYYPLLPGSVAIDAGTNTGCPTTDERGVLRPQDGNGDSIATCDIGAYEAIYFYLYLPLISKN